MRLKECLILTALGMLSGCTLPPQQAPDSHPTVSVTNNGSLITVANTLAAVDGQTIRIGFLHAKQNPDCSLSATEHPVFSITAQPTHGTVTQQQIEDFPSYRANSPMAKCSQSRIPGTVVTYAPQSNYSGTDQFSYQVFSSDGRQLIVNNTVNISP